MKYLFGTDLTADRNNKSPDGLQYRKVTLPAELEASVRSRRDRVEKLEPFTYFPKWLKALKGALWSFGRPAVPGRKGVKMKEAPKAVW